ncbi:hypothetical protein RYX36_009664 [Vicia faba]
MRLYDECKEILKIQKLRRFVSFAGFYAFTTLIIYAYVNNTTRAGYSRADQYYTSYPAGTELLTDTTKLYKAALGNCFESEEWGAFEFCVMEKHQSLQPPPTSASRSSLSLHTTPFPLLFIQPSSLHPPVSTTISPFPLPLSPL